MEYLKLEDCCEILDSKRIPVTANKRRNGKYPYYGANGLQDYVDDYIFDDELVLLAEDGGNFNSKDKPIAYRVSGKCWVNNHAHVLKPKQGISVDYLCYALMYYDVSGLVNGATRQKLTQATMRKMKIPILSEIDQLRIVEIMNSIQQLKNDYRSILHKLDVLIKARFIEMFGDPVADTKNWGQTLLKEHLESIRYGTSTPPIFTDDGYAFIRATNIKNGKIVTNDMKYIPQEEADRLEKCKLSGGEIIIVRSGVNAGDTCVVTDEYIGQYAGYDMILVLSSDLHPVFFNTLINTEYMDKVVKPLTRRAAQPHLNSEQTQRLPIIEVPFELQEQFADFVKQVDKSRFDIKKSITEIEREVVYD